MKLIYIIGLIGTAVQAADVLPPQYNFDRYTKMTEHSPFAIATAVKAAPEINFAKDLYIANAAHSDDGDMVTVASVSDEKFKKYLTTKEPVDGYSIVSVDWSEDIGKTKATISKDGKTALLTFNQKLLASAIKPQAEAPMPAPVAAPTPILRLQPTTAPILPQVQEQLDSTPAPSKPGPPKFPKHRRPDKH